MTTFLVLPQPTLAYLKKTRECARPGLNWGLGSVRAANRLQYGSNVRARQDNCEPGQICNLAESSVMTTGACAYDAGGVSVRCGSRVRVRVRVNVKVRVRV